MERSKWIDVYKGIGIILVVAGHIFEGPIKILYFYFICHFFSLFQDIYINQKTILIILLKSHYHYWHLYFSFLIVLMFFIFL